MKEIRQQFKAVFNTIPSVCVQSPGRINLIGEHTDYNSGFVLPAAINKSAQVALAMRSDAIINMYALDLNQSQQVSIQALQPHQLQWVNYIIGVVAQVQKKLHQHPSALIHHTGFDICIQGDIPIGAGLSSSAAVACAVLFAINNLYNLGLDQMQMALMAQQSEHEFAGVKCGIMDMFASLYGKKNKVILLDCANLEHQYYPLDLKQYEIVLFDTRIKHALASSEYNTRRLECDKGLSLLQEKYPYVKTWREVNLKQVEDCWRAPMSLSDQWNKVYQRSKYVVEEIQRVQWAVKDLLAGDLIAFGKKMFETHEGLSSLYEVSCPELDLLVDAVKDKEEVIGSRMMGGGFGGCTINLIKQSEVDKITHQVADHYAKVTSKTLQVYKVSTEEGTHLL